MKTYITNPNTIEFKDKMALGAFGRSFKDPACVCCGSEKIAPEDFTDDLSRREWSVSHLCQVCQDNMFGDHDEP